MRLPQGIKVSTLFARGESATKYNAISIMIVAARSSGGITLNIEDPMTLNSMLAPLHKTYEALRNLNWYVKSSAEYIVPDAERPMEAMCFNLF
ncbi:hypothetical protein JCM33374_g2361 [Metschnikowia sp. JCM 33374]|nr:hypothetical protein JCM33374_g2361 [Metschnikowia sp. JCM 33374]